MSNETKRDVFETFADECAGYEEDELYKQYLRKYDNALPDDLPVVSKDVSNTMITYCFLWWKEFLDKSYDNELSDEEYINYKVRSESAEVARALILGVWRVEETGEVIRLNKTN